MRYYALAIIQDLSANPQRHNPQIHPKLTPDESQVKRPHFSRTEPARWFRGENGWDVTVQNLVCFVDRDGALVWMGLVGQVFVNLSHHGLQAPHRGSKRFNEKLGSR